MLEERNQKIRLALGSGLAMVILALLGSIFFVSRDKGWLTQWQGQHQEARTQAEQGAEQERTSSVLNLVSLAPEQRESQLEKIAQGSESLNRDRARYLLATDLIEQEQAETALEWLEGLEADYPTLAPQIVWQRARAYELMGEAEKLEETYQEILSKYPQSPVAAEVLYILGQSEPQYWQQAIDEFPNHTRTHEIIRQRLKQNPNQLELLLALAKYDLDANDISKIRDRLFHSYASRLQDEDWEMLAKGYWQQWEYGKAGDAYANAPVTPENAYLAARGRHLVGRRAEARKAYQKMISQYPYAPETGLALRRLASLSANQDALTYLDQVINKFPEEAPEALLSKGKILEQLNSSKSAAQARQKVLDQYANSEAASKYRWQVAQEYAEDGNLMKAWQWAGPIVVNTPESSIAAKAGFWVGKWAQQLGREQDAREAFEHVVTNHPQSYYAWRSAVMLGWDVGNFETVRQKTPQVIQPEKRPLPPAGSASFKELFLMGQDKDAWTLFQAEIENQPEISVAEQFTQGLLKLAKGKNLQGINLVWNLTQRENPQDIESWQALRRTPQYWQALFPIPYDEMILSWSKERSLNPLLVTSVIRQESRFEREIRSSAGAVGLMQVMPGTGNWVAQKINLQDYSLTDPEDNIKLGTWYLDHTHEQYGDNSLLAVASYNAGPGNVANWVKRYGFSDPDIFVEQIPFPETKLYVESVFSNYWNYMRLYNPEVSELLKK